jgi:transcriptional antiterminator RfaH
MSSRHEETTAADPGRAPALEWRPRWYCVSTKPRVEEQVRRSLAARAIDVFNPLVASRRGSGSEALFPGYLFARFALHAHFATVRWACGVRSIVSNAGGPIAVDDSVIEAVRARFPASWPQRPGPGERVQVTGGPFKGIVGVLERSRSGTDRVRLLLNVLHDQVRLEVPGRLVRRAP